MAAACTSNNLNKAGHLFSLRGKCGEGLFWTRLLTAVSRTSAIATRSIFRRTKEETLSQSARGPSNRRTNQSLRDPEPKAAPTPTPAPRATPTSTPRAAPPDSARNAHIHAAPNAKAGAGTQRDPTPRAESNARAARKTAAEASRLAYT